MNVIDNAMSRFRNNDHSLEALKQRAAEQGLIFDLGALLAGDRYRNEATVRGLSGSVYLGDHIALCRVLGRYKMYVDTNDVGMASHLMLDGYWEMWNTEVIMELVRPGMTVLDIGAHCGYFTMLMADAVGAAGSVHAFEPNPAMVALLRRSISINGFDGRVTLHEVALAGRDGKARLSVPANEPKNAHISHDRDPQAIQVISRRVDSIAATLDADFIKIDAEGAETAIWLGMEGLLRRNRALTILLEFTPGRYRHPDRFLDSILAHGFTLSIVDLERGVLPVTRGQVLAGSSTDDQMLLLVRD